ncbi:hypothetical protein PT974_12320 [Cladobotryum mycophilum]|uniref:Uncharacterized protein n=1 Tax=Cladobotryum mycophilum TaxID=491253 RepID=A0ABR0S7P8_9HYPO
MVVSPQDTVAPIVSRIMNSSTPKTRSSVLRASSGSEETPGQNCSTPSEAGASPDQKLLRNHSFQLVKLQSELHELRAQRAKDVQQNAKLVTELQDLYGSVAQLKGKLADLTMELHALKDTSPQPRYATPCAPVRPRPGLQERWDGGVDGINGVTSPQKKVVEKGRLSPVLQHYDVVEALADKFLQGQRLHLLQILKTAANNSIHRDGAITTHGVGELHSGANYSSVESPVKKTPIKQEPPETPSKFSASVEKPPRALSDLFREKLVKSHSQQVRRLTQSEGGEGGVGTEEYVG